MMSSLLNAVSSHYFLHFCETSHYFLHDAEQTAARSRFLHIAVIFVTIIIILETTGCYLRSQIVLNSNTIVLWMIFFEDNQVMSASKKK